MHQSWEAMWIEAGEVQGTNCVFQMEKIREEMQGPALEVPRGATGEGRAVLNTLWEQWITPVLTAWCTPAGVHTV